LRLVGSETLVNPIKAYTHRLHTRWPAGKPEKLPVVREDGATNVPGLDITGEEPDKAYNRLHDHKDFCRQNILVVGGGGSAMEAAIALATCGSSVTLSYRKNEFSRPKPESLASPVQMAELTMHGKPAPR